MNRKSKNGLIITWSYNNLGTRLSKQPCPEVALLNGVDCTYNALKKSELHLESRY